MSDTTREHTLEAIIVDVLDGNREWHEIQYNTGLSEERCREIEKEVGAVFSAYFARHGL
jgi:hypothetical protein